MDERVPQLAKVPPSWKLRHRNNAARRTKHDPNKVLRRSKRKRMEKITSQNRWKSRKVKLGVIRAQPLPPEEESALWENGQMGDFNGKVLTNKNLKNDWTTWLTRSPGTHYDAYVEASVEDLVIRQQEDGTEVVEFRKGPTKTRSGGLSIRRRTTPQVMYSTDGGKTDSVGLFKLWLS